MTRGYSELQANLTRIDLCAAEFTQAVARLQTAISQYQEQVLASLASLRSEMSRDIEAAWTEIQTWGGTELKEKYSVLLLHYTNDTVDLFTYQIDLTSVERYAQTILTFQRSDSLAKRSYYTDPVFLRLTPGSEHARNSLLPWVSKDNISYLDFTSGLLGPSIRLTEPLRAQPNNRWLVLDHDNVFVCGEGTGAAHSYHSTFLVHRSGQVRHLPMLRFAHRSAGVVLWRAAVLVFGSFNRECGKRAERMSLSMSHWQDIGEMQEWRYCFTPVVWRGNVFLCGGPKSPSIEIFNSVTFRLLPLVLPEASNCTTLVTEHVLLVLSSEYLCTLSCKIGSLCLQWKSHDKILIPTKVAPVLQDDVIYMLKPTKVLKVSVESGQLLG